MKTMSANETGELLKNKLFYRWIVVIAASFIYVIGTEKRDIHQIDGKGIRLVQGGYKRCFWS